MAACVLSPPLVVESVDDCGAAEDLSLGGCGSGWLGWVWLELEGEVGVGEVCAMSSPDAVREIKPSNSENRCTFMMGSNWINQNEGCDFGAVSRIRLHPQTLVGLDRRRRTRTRSKHLSFEGDKRSCISARLLSRRRRIARLPADWGN
jgi:hypothetical protein